MKGFGGMLSFELDASAEEAAGMVGRLKLVTPGREPGRGWSRSSASRRAHPTPRSAARSAWPSGVTDTLVRFSVGIEDVEDLMADLDSGFGGLMTKERMEEVV